MSRQYLRQASLIVGDAGGHGLELSELHFKFQTQQAMLETPNSLTARVYNLSDATAQQIQKEFTELTLQVGYKDSGLGLLFAGSIAQIRRGRESATDTYVDIVAYDGDVAYAFAVAAFAVTAGSTFKDRVDALAKVMKLPLGVVADFPKSQMPRGVTHYGMARDEMRDIAHSTDADWFIHNGALNVVPIDGYLPGDPIVLTSNTGMIGMPEQQIDGIHITCLINTRIMPGYRVRVDNKSVQQLQLTGGLLGAKNAALAPSIANDGVYKVIVAEHIGDTRDQEWYSALTCLVVGETSTPLLLKGQL
jgi:hypothetical protein